MFLCLKHIWSRGFMCPRILICDPGRCLELKVPINFLLWFQYETFLRLAYMFFWWIQNARSFNWCVNNMCFLYLFEWYFFFFVCVRGYCFCEILLFVRHVQWFSYVPYFSSSVWKKHKTTSLKTHLKKNIRGQETILEELFFFHQSLFFNVFFNDLF